MGAGQSSPTSVCDFSEEQILKINEEIKKIDALIVNTKRDLKYDDLVMNAGAQIPSLDGANFANYMATLTLIPFEEKNKKYKLLRQYGAKFGLILEHLLYAQVTDLFEKYKTILESITGLCKKYKSAYFEDASADKTIDNLFKEMSEAKKYFDELLLNDQFKIPSVISDKLKETIDIINKINEKFSSIDEFKSEMKAISKQQEDARTARLFSMPGGSSSSRSKKRKQMKMKMKSSNYRSKTRNNKKKYNRKSVKK